MNESKPGCRSGYSEFLNEEVATTTTTDLTALPKVVDYLREEKLFSQVENDNTEPTDVTKRSIQFPTTRSERLQVLTRGQTGAVTSLGYAAFEDSVKSIRRSENYVLASCHSQSATQPIRSNDEENDYYIGEIKVTEVESFVPVSVQKENQCRRNGI